MNRPVKNTNNDLPAEQDQNFSLSAGSANGLFEAIRNGDESAFTLYYHSFVDSLVAFLIKLLGNEEEAKEIVQEVFIKLWEKRETIDPEKKLDSFIYTTAKNMAFNTIRKRQIHSKYVDEQSFIGADPGRGADDNIISKETELLFNLVMNSMPSQRRKVFTLSRNEGLTYEQIAQEMGISLDTVKSHMKLALRDIRDAVLVYVAIFFMKM